MKISLLFCLLVILGLACVEAANQTCLQSCRRDRPGQPYAPSCCDCCGSDATCNGNAIFSECCGSESAYCGCISSRAACYGNAPRAPFTIASTFGTCYPKDYGTCTYNPNSQIWAICPTGTTACLARAGSSADCCTADQTCTIYGTCASSTPAPSTTQSAGALCNGQGYDASMYTCTTNDQGSQVLCSTGLSSCGTACYSSNAYCCQNGALVEKSQCSAAPTSAAPTSAAPTSAAPTSAAPTSASTPATSASGVTTCNGQPIYQPNLYTCATNENGNQILCPTGNSACGSACYNPNTYCCQAGQLRGAGQCSGQGTPTTRPTTSTQNAPSTQVTPSTSASGVTTCNGQPIYQPNLYTCAINQNGNQVLCPTGNSACGDACYSPASYCCSASGALAPAGSCK